MKRTLARTLAAIAGALCIAQPAVAQDAKVTGTTLAMCIGCHGIPGYQASFPEVHKVPMISGQGEKYIAAALAAYRKGERKHPTMRSVAASLTDKDIAELAAYYGQDGRKAGAASAAAGEQAAKPLEPPAKVAELLQKGNCLSCHGADLNKPIDPSYPKLAGQHADYLYVALKQYQTKGNPQIGRENPIMTGMVASFNHQELKTLANYIASLPGDLRTVPQSRFK